MTVQHTRKKRANQSEGYSRATHVTEKSFNKGKPDGKLRQKHTKVAASVASLNLMHHSSVVLSFKKVAEEGTESRNFPRDSCEFYYAYSKILIVLYFFHKKFIASNFVL